MKIAKKQGFPISDTLEQQLIEADIYQDAVNWKTFIPPLPQHDRWPKGWVFICDALLRIPLSIFLQLVCLNYTIEDLEGFSGTAKVSSI